MNLKDKRTKIIQANWKIADKVRDLRSRTDKLTHQYDNNLLELNKISREIQESEITHE